MVERRYRSPRRDEGAAATRTAILRTFAAQLGEPGATDVAVPAAAAAAGVSVRTVYHHFPDREHRLRAVASWAAETLDALPPIAGAVDLPDHARRAHALAGRQLTTARALAVAGRVGADPGRGRRARHLEIAALVSGIGAPAGPTNRARAVVAMLVAPEALVALVDGHGLGVADAGEAAAEAVAAVLGDLRSLRRESGGAA